MKWCHGAWEAVTWADDEHSYSKLGLGCYVTDRWLYSFRTEPSHVRYTEMLNLLLLMTHVEILNICINVSHYWRIKIIKSICRHLV